MRLGIGRLAGWVWSKIELVSNEIVEELGQMRSVLCWIYGLGYGWLVWYCVTNNHGSMNTAITVTGGVVSAIFASYVFVKSRETIAGIISTKSHPEPSSEEESGDA
jgi:hydroxyethylthiazole kinase-like sugar kinase family protein